MTISDSLPCISADDELQYKENLKTYKLLKKWIQRADECTDSTSLEKVFKGFKKTKLVSNQVVSNDFLFWHYATDAVNDWEKAIILFDYISNYYTWIEHIIALYLMIEQGLLQGFFEVLYHPNANVYSRSWLKRDKQKFNAFLSEYHENRVEKEVKSGYASDINMFFEESVYRILDEKMDSILKIRRICVYRYFELFDDYIEYRKGDLTNVDLSGAIFLNKDLSDCKTNENTFLPSTDKYTNNARCETSKIFDGEKFIVTQVWRNTSNAKVGQKSYTFDDFDSFVSFLNNDLSNADLTKWISIKPEDYDRLTSLKHDGIMLPAEIRDPLDLNCGIIAFDKYERSSFPSIISNENETALALSSGSISSSYQTWKNSIIYDEEFIYYISDLHLLHRLKNKAYTIDGIKKCLYDIVETIVSESSGTVLIGGDVSSDYQLFEIFVHLLREQMDETHHKADIIFVLGNHELWGFPDHSFSQITEAYYDLLSTNGMYLLQNDLLYKEDFRIKRIPSLELDKISEKELREKLRKAQFVLVGGLAFSGCNKTFNADNGIYRNAINRETEILESAKFEKLYEKVTSYLYDKKIIVFTHTPKDCWSTSTEYKENCIYVSGHTHRNHFYDDGHIRLYCDNQIGYTNNSIHMKFFSFEKRYDYFSDYEDGIYEISRKDYIEFYRGKNIMMFYNREGTINMLKRNGYYCFILSDGNKLYLLNGGARKTLDYLSLEYYYDNMDRVIANLKDPLSIYTAKQKEISDCVKKFGGVGRIHGCIIDINHYNHIYLNPFDGSVTAYWAWDIYDKKIYSSVPSLLKQRLPELYSNYVKLLSENTDGIYAITPNSMNDLDTPPIPYEKTDIYKASREIRKMTKIYVNILTSWIEESNNSILSQYQISMDPQTQSMIEYEE